MVKPATKLQFTLNWRASFLALALLPVLVSLGFWQLDRADEKRALQALFQERQSSGVIDFEDLTVTDDLRYQPIRFVGRFLNEKIIFLDNRIYKGRFGYEIIVPFEVVDSNQLLLVNRGWVEGDRSRRTLPTIEPVLGSVLLTGEVYVPQGEMLSLGKSQTTSWPRVLQSVDVASLANEFEQKLFPYTVRLSVDSVAVLQPNWVVINLQPAKHTGYAVQWFAMSFTLLIIMFLANSNCWSLFKSRKR
jgi:cytochrome oxidase assembly protein ShyY1